MTSNATSTQQQAQAQKSPSIFLSNQYNQLLSTTNKVQMTNDFENYTNHVTHGNNFDFFTASPFSIAANASFNYNNQLTSMHSSPYANTNNFYLSTYLNGNGYNHASSNQSHNYMNERIYYQSMATTTPSTTSSSVSIASSSPSVHSQYHVNDTPAPVTSPQYAKISNIQQPMRTSSASSTSSQPYPHKQQQHQHLSQPNVNSVESLDSDDQSHKPPVIYAWMKKAHLANSGEFFRTFRQGPIFSKTSNFGDD
jgi:hypothetical protein